MHARKLILVGWDAADWQIAQPLWEAGRLPALANLIRQGASGPLENSRDLYTREF
ncbi:MAG: hypothetical protein E1N59_1517 [Puniceicoccaceae bacterium 5H]|nr:MAG: hypothetical protein E1N59_1517 [Puniceicoccaceae bacterium 5H]